MKNKAGAPKGGRVHWLLWSLPADFKGAYILHYDYAYHNYVFYRLNGRKLYDCFIVFRSSKHYFMCTYFNSEKNTFCHFGYNKATILAESMYEIYQQNKDIEREK